jgi:hypothetical protein
MDLANKFEDLDIGWILTGKRAKTPSATSKKRYDTGEFGNAPLVVGETPAHPIAHATAHPRGKKLDFMPKVITVDASGRETILYVHIKAYAGYLVGYSDPEFLGHLESFRLPGLPERTYRMFDAKGPSMGPTILHEDKVITEYVPSFDDIRDGHVYVLVTHSRGIVLKRVLNRISERGKLVCKSDTIAHRHEYKTYQLDPEDIKEVWYARLKVSADFSEPAEIYHRVNDLESDMADIKQILGGIKGLKAPQLKVHIRNEDEGGQE